MCVVPEGPYIKHWGVYPQQDRGKSYISLSDVAALAESPRGERSLRTNCTRAVNLVGMGYTIFTVVFTRIAPVKPTGQVTLLISFAIQMGRGWVT